MKMKDVCEVVKQAGMNQVSSVLASGNILFQTDENKAELRKRLELALTKWYQEEVSLLVFDEMELKSLLAAVPFASNDAVHLYVFLCEAGFETTLEALFQTQSKGPLEEAMISQGFFFWQVAKQETLHTEFSKVLGKKAYKTKFTSRNLNTIHKIVSKMQ